MTPLEIIVLVIATLTALDLIIAIFKPKSLFRAISKIMTVKNAWIQATALLLVAVIFAYFSLQSLTIIQIIPGLFIGVLLIKAALALHPKEIMPVIKKIYTETDWFSIILDLIIIGAVLWVLF